MRIVTITPDLPGEPKGDVLNLKPGAVNHYEMFFSTPKFIRIDADGTGLVIISILDPPVPPPPPPTP